MSAVTLTPEARARALSIRDLTNPALGPHAMQLLLQRILNALAGRWQCAVQLHRASPVVTVWDNYDRLRYPPDGAARDARYTRYVSEDHVLRTQTSAMIPPLLRDGLRHHDVLLACPGLVYRRDCIDRLHVGEPHQVDLWRVSQRKMSREALLEMVELVTHAVMPGAQRRVTPAVHPYTVDGLQMDVLVEGEWVEIGECGLANPELLRQEGLNPDEIGGLAMGIGLDRALMLVKRIPDIRLLRSEDPRIALQMLDLAPYRPVSTRPPMRRDLSIVTDADVTQEELGDAVREALGERAAVVETVAVRSETGWDALPAHVRERLGMRAGQKNVLLEVVLRHVDRTLRTEEANEARDDIYRAVHRGTKWEWAKPRAG